MNELHTSAPGHLQISGKKLASTNKYQRKKKREISQTRPVHSFPISGVLKQPYSVFSAAICTSGAELDKLLRRTTCPTRGLEAQ